MTAPRYPMSAAQLKDLLRVGCVQVFVPVVQNDLVVWLHTTQREARYLRKALKGQIDVAPPHWALDHALAARCGGGKILRLVPRSLHLDPTQEWRCG